MGDIAADGHVQTFQVALAAADRQGVKQRLGGMFVAAVTGVDDSAIDLFRQQLDGPGIPMPDNQNIWMHRI